MLKSLVGYIALQLVALLWLWVGDRNPLRRLRLSDERHVEHRRNAALIVHKMHAVLTFNEPMSRIDHALTTFLVIFGDGARGNSNHSDTGMMVPASRASGLELNPYISNVCRMLWAFERDAVVVS